MAGKKRPAHDAPQKEPKARAPRTLAGRAQHELDPEWRQWFFDVERRRKATQELKSRKFIVSSYQKDGEERTVARCKSEPIQIKKLIKKEIKAPFGDLNIDLLALRDVWAKVVPPDIATESEIFSFKNGILIITVQSGILLQEIRQFHSKAIAQDLRDAWPIDTPLLKLSFKIGAQ